MTQPAGTTVLGVKISGRVQGVYYRAWTMQEASARNLTGWVRNCRDGSVEALFCGADQQVRDMVLACREGPPRARVSAVEELSTTGGAGDVPGDFRQLPTV